MHVVHSPVQARHDPAHEVLTGTTIDCFEKPARAEAILAALQADPAFDITLPVEHGLGPIEAVHDPGYVAWLAHAWEDWTAAVPDVRDAIPDTFLNPAVRVGMGPGRPPLSPAGRLGWYGFDTATAFVDGTYAAARAAVDVALSATDLVLGGAAVAYGLCRPPGHHAPHAAYGGYCYFNNAAIGADHAIRNGASRVAILDVDYHHGNGTQQIFYDCPDVFYVSLHADPERAYPYFTGWTEESGAGAGLGANVNLPLPVGCDDDTWLAVLDHALDLVDTYDPALIVVSLGVDNFGLDPLGDLALTEAAYHPAGAAVASLSRPTVIVQEGGYHIPTIGGVVRSWLRGAASLTEEHS
jgi:acetoin utilization deacetylase AcuC-like enzyme